MLIDEIPIGANIEIEVRYKGKSVSFNSKVIYLHQNSILIDPIVVNDKTIGFNDNCRVNLIVKIDGKVYLWDNVAVKLVKYDGKIYHQISIQGEGKPYNRREAYRMYIGEDMPIYLNTAQGPTTITVLVKDISETGVGFITKEELDINRTIRLKLKDFNNLISLSGIIVRKEFLPHLDSFLYGCKFHEKNNKLGRFIARKQGEQLQKRLGNYSSPHVIAKNISTRKR